MAPELFAIVAMTPGRVIGKGGTLPWRLPADLAHFRRHSLGVPNVMGRKVWDSLGGRALPGRANIVLTRNRALTAPGATVVHTPEEALAAARDAPRVAIIGGEEVYRLYLPQLSRIELTLVHAEVQGDTFFPELPAGWQVTQETVRPADERNPHDLTFQTLVRAGSTVPRLQS